MKKSDLKTGMRVKTTNNTIYIVMIEDFNTMTSGITSMLVSNHGYMPLNDYNDNLICSNDEFNINEVYDSPSNRYPDNMLNPNTLGKLLWKRKKQIIFKEFIKSKGIDWNKFKENCRIENQRWSSKSYYKDWKEYKKLSPMDWTSKAFSWEHNILNKTTKELFELHSDWFELIKNADPQDIKFK